MSQAAAAPPPPPGIVEIDGQPHIRNDKGQWVHVSTIKPHARLEDDMVRRLVAKAQEKRAMIAAFRDETFAESEAFQELLNDRYGVAKGGEKGNVSYTTVDGCMRMQVAVAAVLTFGPELQAAKLLVDECLKEWGAATHPVLRALITESFNTDQEGRLNRSAIFRLLRQECDDPRWARAMDAIRDSIRPAGTRQYVRFHVRATPKDPWVAVSLDAATA